MSDEILKIIGAFSSVIFLMIFASKLVMWIIDIKYMHYYHGVLRDIEEAKDQLIELTIPTERDSNTIQEIDCAAVIDLLSKLRNRRIFNLRNMVDEVDMIKSIKSFNDNSQS